MRVRAASATLLVLCLVARSIGAGADTVSVTAGPDVDAANNDFRRIQDAINAAVSELDGSRLIRVQESPGR